MMRTKKLIVSEHLRHRNTDTEHLNDLSALLITTKVGNSNKNNTRLSAFIPNIWCLQVQ